MIKHEVPLGTYAQQCDARKWKNFITIKLRGRILYERIYRKNTEFQVTKKTKP